MKHLWEWIRSLFGWQEEPPPPPTDMNNHNHNNMQQDIERMAGEGGDPQ